MVAHTTIASNNGELDRFEGRIRTADNDAQVPLNSCHSAGWKERIRSGTDRYKSGILDNPIDDRAARPVLYNGWSWA